MEAHISIDQRLKEFGYQLDTSHYSDEQHCADLFLPFASIPKTDDRLTIERLRQSSQWCPVVVYPERDQIIWAHFGDDWGQEAFFLSGGCETGVGFETWSSIYQLC